MFTSTKMHLQSSNYFRKCLGFSTRPLLNKTFAHPQCGPKSALFVRGGPAGTSPPLIHDQVDASRFKIIEIKKLSSILAHVPDRSLCVFDLDNTLLEPCQQLGSDQWVSYRVDRLVKQGLSAKDALDQTILCWMAILKKTNMKLVERAIPALFDRLEQMRISRIALTKRDPRTAEKTIEQLKQLNLTFTPASHLKTDQVFWRLRGTCYRKEGVIFVSSTVNKGPALLSYLKKLDKLPSRIVAVDDKRVHLTSIAEAARLLNVPFVGLRYGGMDEKVKNFNAQVADLQLHHFFQILSDEDALKLL